MDERAASPVVGKALEAGLVLVVVGVLSTALFGGFVPAVRERTDRAVGERALAAAAARVEGAVPPVGRAVRVRLRVDLPTHVGGDAYVVRATGRTLVLDHPDPAVGGRATLHLPDRVVAVRGRWRSTDRNAVVVRGGPDGVVVRLA
ncbi:MAG: hypothetical protein ABEJ70_01420 [Halobacteriaceae archaeon]